LIRVDDWKIEIKGFYRGEEPNIGTILTLANGRMGVRGEFELLKTEQGLFHMGVYDDAPIFKREIVVLPDIRFSTIWIDDYRQYSLKEGSGELTRILDMRDGILYSYLVDPERMLKYASTRIVHRKFKDLFIMISDVEYPGKVALMELISSRTANPLEPPAITIKHYRILDRGFHNEYAYMLLETLNRSYRIAIAMYSRPLNKLTSRREYLDDDYIGNILVGEGGVSAIRYVVVKTSIYSSSPLDDALESLQKYVNLDLEELIRIHKSSWRKLWGKVEFEAEDKSVEGALRFYTYHLMQLYDDDAEYLLIPARGLHGIGYRGHVFWDADIYLLPFYTHFIPDAARKILIFRWKTLGKAMEIAKLNGYMGAQYPWEAVDDGSEAAPDEVPLDYRWDRKARVWTGLEEIHVTADIAYAVDYYYEYTKDEDFMLRYGLRMIFETARYWLSRMEYFNDRGCYGVKKVIGPDEYHVHVNNSFYTNLLAAYNLHLAYKYYIKALRDEAWRRVITEIGVSPEEVERAKRISEMICVSCRSDGVCEEFDGYFKLRDIVITDMGNHRPVRPHELGINVEETTVIKQADVVLAQLMMHVVGYRYPGDLAKNYEYYIKRTAHESSLSMPIYAAVAALTGKLDDALALFKKVLMTDLENLYMNTRDGFHVAAAGGLWWAILHGFLGMRLDNGKILISKNIGAVKISKYDP